MRVIEHFASMFDSVSELKESICLLVTQVPKEKSKEDVKKTLMCIMKDNQRFDPKAKELMGYFCENIEIFYALQEKGLLETKCYSDFIQSIKQKVKYFFCLICLMFSMFWTTTSGRGSALRLSPFDGPEVCRCSLCNLHLIHKQNGEQTKGTQRSCSKHQFCYINITGPDDFVWQTCN